MEKMHKRYGIMYGGENQIGNQSLNHLNMLAGTLSASEPQKLSVTDGDDNEPVAVDVPELLQMLTGISYTTALNSRSTCLVCSCPSTLPSAMIAITMSPVNPARRAEPRNSLKSLGLEQAGSSVPRASDALQSDRDTIQSCNAVE